MATINLNSLSPDDKSLNNAESICFSMDFSQLTANLKIAEIFIGPWFFLFFLYQNFLIIVLIIMWPKKKMLTEK